MKSVSEIGNQEVDPRTLAPGSIVLGPEGNPHMVATSKKIPLLMTTDSSLDDDWGFSARNQTAYMLRYKSAKWQQPKDFDAMRLYKELLPVAASAFTVQLGTDPEIFSRVRPKGDILPAFAYLPNKTTHSTIYWDGFQAEFSTKSAHCMEILVSRLRHQLARIYKKMRKKFPESILSHESVVELSKTMLETAQEEHVALGCDPSLNVYGTTGRACGNPRGLRIRFAGGHMHFGVAKRLRVTQFNQEEIRGAIKMLDALLGVAMVSMADGYDDPRRREYYGQAGEFRLPKHGIEYRTLSNFWITSPALFHLAFDIGRAACRLGMQGMRSLVDVSDEEVQTAINLTDSELARRLMKRNEGVWLKLLGSLVSTQKSPKESFAALLGGPQVVDIDPSKITDNWRLDGYSYEAFYNEPDPFSWSEAL